MTNIHWQWLGLRQIQEILNLQNELFEKKTNGEKTNFILLCEHYPCYTYSRINFEKCLKIKYADFLKLDIPAIKLNRAGGVTFHGPGQLAAYFIFDTKKFGLNLFTLPEIFSSAVIKLLQAYSLQTSTLPQNPDLAANHNSRGVWIDGRRKIMSRGLNFKITPNGYITQFGFALNISLDLKYFSYIYPCGLEIEMTSLEKETGLKVKIDDIRAELLENIIKEPILNY